MLFVPATIQIAHAFESHPEFECCINIDDQHFHSDDLDCTLCHLQAEPSSFIPNFPYVVLPPNTSCEQFNFYISYKDYQRLSYSLRGPPAL